jgi:hypothetical protein
MKHFKNKKVIKDWIKSIKKTKIKTKTKNK